MEELVRQAKQWNIDISKDQVDQFKILLQELKTWNAHINLTAITDDADIIQKHFLDSLSVLQVVPQETATLIDVGTGAGFPGLPLSIMRPELEITLLESVQKKVSFLTSCIGKLHLSHTKTIAGRAEDIGQQPEYREHFDVAVARAVAELRVLAEYCLPLVRPGGLWIAQKSSGSVEIDDARQAIALLGGIIEKRVPIQTDHLANRELIVIKKVSPTPAVYPRRAGVPIKKPL